MVLVIIIRQTEIPISEASFMAREMDLVSLTEKFSKLINFAFTLSKLKFDNELL